MIVTVMTVVIVLDQSVKRVVTDWLGPLATDHRWELAGRLLAFEYVENTGAAFGMFAGQDWFVSVLAIAVAALFIVLIVLPHSGRSLQDQLAIGLILGGAAGNLIDRIRLGHVVDYLAVGAWPKFNVADSSITIGVAIVLIRLLRNERTAREESATSPRRPPRSLSSVDRHREGNGIAH